MPGMLLVNKLCSNFFWDIGHLHELHIPYVNESYKSVWEVSLSPAYHWAWEIPALSSICNIDTQSLIPLQGLLPPSLGDF